MARVGLWGYVREVFNGQDCASFARWATAATVGTGCWAVVFLVARNGALPDAAELAALAVWMTAPYGINKVTALLEPARPGGNSG